jgi:mono/diheme cytochrome c family protein
MVHSRGMAASPDAERREAEASPITHPRYESRLIRQLVVVALLVARSAAAAPPEPLDGRALYLRQCASCHGTNAAGDGPDAALFTPRPRNLRDGYLAAYPTQQVARKILDGAHHALSFDVPKMRARAADTESLAAYLRRLPSINWVVVDPGEVLFAERCAPCHGAYGRPGDQSPPGVRPPRDLSDPTFQRGTSDAEMVMVVRHGRAGMPALTPRLSEDQARSAAAFVRLLSPGYVTYTQHCAQCHGDHGIGVGSMAESFPAPTVIFDQAYFARRDPEALRASIWHMLEQHQPSMPHFRGTISEAQAAAIAQYLKQPNHR